MSDEFRLGGADLGVDSERSSIALTGSGILTAELSAAATPAEALEWALAPPLLYFRRVALTAAADALRLTVDEDVLDEYDIALYFVGHRDVRGTLTFRPEGLLTFTGIVVSDDADPAQQPAVSGRQEIPISVRWARGGAGI